MQKETAIVHQAWIIGAGGQAVDWAVRCLLHGWQVWMTTPPEAMALTRTQILDLLVQARTTCAALCEGLPATEGTLDLLTEAPPTEAIRLVVLAATASPHLQASLARMQAPILQIEDAGRAAAIRPDDSVSIAARTLGAEVLAPVWLMPQAMLWPSTHSTPAATHMAETSLQSLGFTLAADSAPAPLASMQIAPLQLVQRSVLPGWIDYNGHLTESRYLYLCSETTDALLARIGAGCEHVAAAMSYFTAESHLRHLGEARLGNVVEGSVQVLAASPKHLHVFVRLARRRDLLATIEQVLVHVDLRSRRACPAPAQIVRAAQKLAQEHSALGWPEGAGRRVAERRG